MSETTISASGTIASGVVAPDPVKAPYHPPAPALAADYGPALEEPALESREVAVIAHLKAWVRRELAMAGDLVSAADREKLNP